MSVLSRALVAFDERRADPTVNLGTLGAAGNVAYTGTVRLAPTTVAYVRLPGVAGNTVACTAPALVTQFEAVPLGGGSSTTGAATGGAAFSFSTAGSWERVRLKNVGGDTLAEFVPPNDEGATGVTDAYSVAWTINRSTGATYKTEVVAPGTGSRLLNGTSDFGEVANLAGLNASDSFTVFALARQLANQPTSAIVAKKDNLAAGAGYALYHLSPSNGLIVADGTNVATRTSTPTLGELGFLAGIRNTANDTLAVHYNGTTLATTADPTTTTLANSSTLRVGRLSGSGTSYANMRLYAWGVFPGALTSAELTRLRTALTTTAPTTGRRTLELTTPARTLEITA